MCFVAKTSESLSGLVIIPINYLGLDIGLYTLKSLLQSQCCKMMVSRVYHFSALYILDIHGMNVLFSSVVVCLYYYK